MSCFIKRKDVKGIDMDGLVVFRMLDEAHGCVAGCCSGINVYTATEYLTPGVHEDQEGFLVLEGTGWAKVGDEEFRIEPEVAYLAPAGVKHCVKKDPGSKVLKIFWFHSAV